MPQWSNALCSDRKERDVLGVGAYDGEKLVGLAGCSADADEMWQIGVDVLQDYRRNGTLPRFIISKPNFLILHGKDDATVQHKTFSQTIDWFKKHEIDFEKAEFEGLDHKMNDEEMQLAADFVNS